MTGQFTPFPKGPPTYEAQERAHAEMEAMLEEAGKREPKFTPGPWYWDEER